jgi:capsular polysaccharide transport system permease protein
MVGGIDEADGSVLPTGGSGAAPGAAGSMQELLTRLPQPRSASGQAGTPVQPPLQRNREFRGATIDEPIAPPSAEPRADVRERPAVTQDEQEPRVYGLPLPQRVTHISTGRKLWFGVSFLLPVILGAIYLFLITPDQYVTEFRFSVRVPVGQQGALASGGASTSALFGGNPTPGTDLLDNFTVADYVRSPQAAADLDAKLNLKDMFNKPADPFSRVGGNANREKLARFWKSMVYSDYDVTTGLAVVRVKAYSAQDSYAMANALLQQSNDLVNSIGTLSQQDTVRFAQRSVERVQQKVADLRRQIATLSQHGGLDNPSIGVLPASTALATNTRTAVSQIQREIEVLMEQLHNPDAPQIVMLRQELAANERALNQAVNVANADPTNQYADLTTQLTSTLSLLASTQVALSNAQVGADAQRLYLTTYVKPILAQSPTGPDRWMDLFLIMLISGMVWTIGMLFRNSILEHGR